MDIVSILFSQILLMFLYIFLGVLLFKTKKLTLEGSKSLGQILLYAVIPCVVIKAFNTTLTPEKLKALIISFVLALGCLLLAMAISHLFFKNQPVQSFGAAFSNAGFIGIPIVSAVLGDEAVFYVSSFVALLNVLQWTYGVFFITKDKSMITLKKITTNPVCISLVVGIVIFILQIPLPSVASKAIAGIANLNAPLAMFSVGTYLAQIDFKEIFTSKLTYKTSLVRLIVIPLITLVILYIIPGIDNLMKLSLLIVAACPVGSNVAIFAQLFDCDYQSSVRDICLSTLLCIFTMPLIVYLFQMICIELI